MNYQPKPGSHAETLVNAIRKHGVAIRSPELATLTGVDANSITPLLKTALSAGLVSCCKVTIASRPPTNEWRPGPGMPRGGDATLKSASLGRPVIPVRESATTGAQPAVAPLPKAASNTGSPRGEPSSVRPAAPPARAVADKPPQTKPGLPPVAAAAGDDIHINISQDATLVIANAETCIELNPAQVLALGGFLHATKRLWRHPE